MGAKDISKTMTLKDRVSGTLKNINGGTVQYKKNLKGLKTSANQTWKAVKVGVMAGAAAAAAGAVGFAALVNKTADAGDRIDKMSQKMGLSIQGFQELEYVLGQNGMEIEQLSGGMKSLTDHMDGVRQGSKGSAEIFRRMGLDASVAAKTQEEAFKDVILALQTMPAGAEKAALAQKMFGRSAQELMPLINSQNGTIEELSENFHKLGGAMSEKAVKNSAKFKDTLDNLKVSIQGAFHSLAAPALPAFTRGIQWVIDKVPLIRQYATSAFEAIKKAIESNVEKFNHVKAAIDEIKNKIFGAFSPEGEGGGAVAWMIDTGIPKFVDGVAGLLSAATDVYNYVSDNWSKFEPLIYGIVGGLIAYKIAIKGIAAWKQIAAAAQWVWNAAMGANPLGLVVLGVAALIAVGTLLIKNLDNIKLAGQKTWNGILTGAEYMVNGVIAAINWMADKAVKPLNTLIEGVNKVTGSKIKPIEMGISAVDFSTAKYDVEDKEFDWRWKKSPGGDGQDAIMAEVTAQQKKYELEQKQQATSQTQLASALEENTEMLHSTRGGGNSFNITVVGTDLTAEEIADKLVPRIERKLFA